MERFKPMNASLNSVLEMIIDIKDNPDFSRSALKYFLMGKGITTIENKNIDDELLFSLLCGKYTSSFQEKEVDQLVEIMDRVNNLIGKSHPSYYTVEKLTTSLVNLKKSIPIELKKL